MAGFTWGGTDGATWGGPNGGSWGIAEPEPPESLETTLLSDRTITVSWTLIGQPDVSHVERALSVDGAPDTWERIATVDYPSAEYTDADDSKLDDERYHYRVIAENAMGESDPSTSVLSDRLPIPPVESLAVVAVDGRRSTLSWIDPCNNTDHYEVLLRAAGTADWNIDDGDVTAVNEGETAEYQTTELLDGWEYEATVETHTANNSVSEADS